MEPRNGDIYNNWKVVAPDGRFMFHGNDKRVNWYLSNGLAHKISDTCIKLDFEPNGPGCQDRYRRQKFQNQCVVCGSGIGLTIHHVVPYQYRRHLCHYFPFYLRDFHDCLALCIKCHKRYERGARLGKDIAQDFGIPLGGVIDAPYSVIDLQRNARLASALVKWGDKMPGPRKAKLTQRLRDFAGDDVDISGLALAQKEDFGYQTHGELVIEQVVRQDRADVFVQLWRRDFLDRMQPRFLPQYWEVQRPVFRTRQHLDNYR